MASTPKRASAWALLLGASLVLAACTGGGTETDETDESNEPVTFTYAYEQEWQAYNTRQRWPPTPARTPSR